MAHQPHRALPGRLSRREVLLAGSGTVAMVVMSGCGLFSTSPDRSAGQTAANVGDRESPMLAALVKQGKLPPLRERLPAKPLVVPPWERPGRFGGSWDMYIGGPTQTFWLQRTIGYDNLVRWDRALEKVAPNVAESFTFNGDATVYTFTLRRGLRWSDGKPFTADDVVFAQNDVLNNRELNPAAGTEHPRAEKVDDVTVRLVLPRPNGLLLQQQSSPYSGWGLVALPMHYFRQFHKAYNPDVAQLVTQAGMASWSQLFQARGGTVTTPWSNSMPTLGAWVITTPIGAGDTVVAERNPYYWKVDPDGRQLPYVDKVTYRIVADPEIMLLQASAGHVDYDSNYVNRSTNKPVLADKAASGNFRLVPLQNGFMNQLVLGLNLAHVDPTLRGVFNNKDFRIALSHAINRDEIINTAYQRQGKPWQAAPRPEGPFHDEEMGTQYTEYNVAKANDILDRVGYAKRDGNGIRLGPTGKPISFAIAYLSTGARAPADLQLVVQHWKAVGIDARINPEDSALYNERRDTNKHDAVATTGDGGGAKTYDAILSPSWYGPLQYTSTFAYAWFQWQVSGGRKGLEPPEPAKQQVALYARIGATSELEQQRSMFRDILRIAKEQFWVIGVSLPPPGYAVVTNSLRNVPDGMLVGAIPFHVPAVYNPEQFYFTQT